MKTILTISVLAVLSATTQATYNFYVNTQCSIFFSPLVSQFIDQTNGIRGIQANLINQVGQDVSAAEYGIRFGYISSRISTSSPNNTLVNGFFETRLTDTITVNHPLGIPVTLNFSMPTHFEPLSYVNMTNASMNGSVQIGGQVRITCEFGKFLNTIVNNPPQSYQQTFPSGTQFQVRHNMILRANPQLNGNSCNLDFLKGSYLFITPQTQGGFITSSSGASYSPIGTKPR